MGFLDVLSGGGSTGADEANRAALVAKEIIKGGYADLYELIDPYARSGNAALDKLGMYLGTYEKPYGSQDELRNAVMQSPEYMSRRQPLMQSIGNDTTTWDYAKLDDYVNSEWQMMLDKEEAAKSDPLYGSLLDPFTLEDYEESPNYQFNLEEGQKALDRASAARGNYLSPSAVKELSRYSQDLASNEFLNSYNMDMQNKGSIYDMLMGNVNVGQNAINQQASNTQNYVAGRVGVQDAIANIATADAAAKNSRRQSAFNNLVSLGSKFAGIPGLGGGNPLSMATSAMGFTGGFDPTTGITWNSGRYY